MLKRRRVAICCLQETRWKGEGCRFIGDSCERYKFFWVGSNNSEGGVGILVDEELIRDVITVSRVGPRIIFAKIKLGDKIWNILSAYAPQQGRSMEEKTAFWESLVDVAGQIPPEEEIFVGGDLNGHVGVCSDGYDTIHGGWGYGRRNNDGNSILDFAESLDLSILNTFFKKQDSHLISYVSGETCSQIDFVLARTRSRKNFKDVKCIPGEECVPQHRLLVACISITTFSKGSSRDGCKRIKSWRLRDPNVKSRYSEKVASILQTDAGWTGLKDTLILAAKEVCGISSGRPPVRKRQEGWWWNADIQAAIKDKKAAFKNWQKSKSDIDKSVYVQHRNAVKRAVAAAKSTEFANACAHLQVRDRTSALFKMAKQARTDRQDIVGATCIRGNQKQLLLDQKEVCERWASYFEALLNKTNGFDDPEDDLLVEGPIEVVQKTEVAEAIKAMKPGKAPGPTGLSADMLKAAGEPTIQVMTNICRSFWATERLPDDFHRSTTVPIYKGKGDPLDCASYRGIRLLEHGLKVIERVLEKRLRKIINVSNMQYGFMPNKSTTDAIFIFRQLQEKYLAKGHKLHHLFVDLEKAFDRVPRRIVQWALRRQGVPEGLVRLVMATYSRSLTAVATPMGPTRDVNITVGVHQGSVLSPLLFITVMEEATKVGRIGSPWELLYADDLVITASDETELSEMFKRWADCLAMCGLKINTDKTQYMISGEDRATKPRVRHPCSVCHLGVGRNSIQCSHCLLWCHKRCSGLITLPSRNDTFVCPTCANQNYAVATANLRQGPIVVDNCRFNKVQTFKYLGDSVSCAGGPCDAIRNRIQAAWQRWKTLAQLLMRQDIPLAARSGVYKACLRPVLLYGSETWPMTKELELKLERTEMKMLRWMQRIRLTDHIRNSDILAKMNLSPISEALRVSRLRWFGHVTRSEDPNISYVRDLKAPGRAPRGRPKRTWRQTIQADLHLKGLRERDAHSRLTWRRGIQRPTSLVGTATLNG